MQGQLEAQEGKCLKSFTRNVHGPKILGCKYEIQSLYEFCAKQMERIESK
jgi:hypothetical protein